MTSLHAAPFAEVAARDAALRDLTFVDGGHGFAVGDRGVALRTDDGGRSWTRLETPTEATLYGVSFVDRRNGWAVGGAGKPFSSATRGEVLRTRDGGATWQPLRTDTLPLLRWVRFFDERNGVAVGAGGAFHPSGVFVTGDGGRSWRPLPSEQPEHWLAAGFDAPEFGVAVSARGAVGMIAKREVRPIGATAGDRRGFHAVTLTGQTSGWIVGDGGAVLTTRDAGRSWQPPEGAPPEITRDVCDWRAVAARGDHVWVVGSPGTAVLHSRDGGQSWRLQPTGVATPLHAVTFVDKQRGWAAGSLGTLLATDDGGKTWRVQRSGGERLALDTLIADRRDAPAELIAKQGAAEGYLAAIALLFGDESGASLASDTTRLAQAAIAAGGADASTDWRLPLTADDRRLDADTLLDRLDRRTDGKAWEELQRALIKRLRVNRPSAVAVVDPAESASPGAAALLARAVEEAVARAADPAAAPDLAALGLGPWRVDRVVQLTADGLRSTDGFSTGNFEPQLGTSISQWSSAARRLVLDAYQPPASRVGWRTLVGNGAAEGRRGDLLAGLSLPRGGGARRPAATPPAGNLDQLRAAAQKRRNLQQLLARREGDAAWAGQVVNLTAGLDADSGAALLYQLAVGYRDTGKLDLAADTFYLLAKRYNDHPLTEPALAWLLRYYASSEMGLHAAATARRFRDPQPLANVSATAARQSPPTAADLDAVAPAGDRLGVLTGDDRFERATRLAAYLRDTRPEVYADPPVRFAVAAAKRRLGYEKDSRRILLLLGKQAIDPAWRRCADAERWFAKPTELPPDKPIAVCKSVATRPHLDGELGDACWSGAERITLRPLRADAAAERPAAGVVRFVRDEQFLYLAIECPKAPGADDPPTTARRPRDGDLTGHDRVTLRIDTDRDYTTAFELTIDARGWPGDRLIVGRSWDAVGWNPTWYVAADRDDKRWRAEAAVPLAMLASPPPTPRDVWAVGVSRHGPGGDATTAAWTDAGPDSPDHFGLLLMK